MTTKNMEFFPPSCGPQIGPQTCKALRPSLSWESLFSGAVYAMALCTALPGQLSFCAISRDGGSKLIGSPAKQRGLASMPVGRPRIVFLAFGDLPAKPGKQPEFSVALPGDSHMVPSVRATHPCRGGKG